MRVSRAGRRQDNQSSMNKLKKRICDTGVSCICLFLAVLFFWSSLHKFSDPEAFARLISKNVDLHRGFVGWISLWLPCFEIALAMALLISKAQRAALVLAASLLAFFALLISVNLLRGLEVPCGCFSNKGEPATWWNVLRNLLLFSLAIGALFLKRKSPCFL